MLQTCYLLNIKDKRNYAQKRVSSANYSRGAAAAALASVVDIAGRPCLQLPDLLRVTTIIKPWCSPVKSVSVLVHSSVQ